MTDSGIRALIFDYGGVLMRTADPTPRRELERKLGLSPGETLRLVFENPRWDDAQVGQIDSDTFWAGVGRELGLSADELATFRARFWAGDRLDDELVALIRTLREEGYRTALLSNAPAELRSYLGELGIIDAFDVIVISAEERMAKPDRAIYDLALERLGVEAYEAIFVDDLRVNVAAARKVSLHATRFLGLAPLRIWLREVGVSVPAPAFDPLGDIRAVVFDWGGVMENLPSDGHIAEWERRLALAPDTLPEVLWGKAWRQFSLGVIDEKDYAQCVADGLGLPDAEKGQSFIDAFYAGDRFNPEVIAAARTLRDHYRVVLLSNAFPRQAEVIRRRFGVDVATDFDVYVNSAHVGLRKPDPAIYRLTLDQLGLTPQQVIFLDDGLRNIDAAREIGIHAIQFVDPENTLSKLEALLGHSIIADMSA